MIYVLKGNADNIIEEIPYKMSDGDIFLLPPGVVTESGWEMTV